MMIRLYYKLPHDIAARTELTPSSKLVYAVLSDRMGKNGKAWPGHRRIAADAGMDRKTVCRSIRQLTDACLLAVERRGNGQTNQYRLMDGTGPRVSPVGKPAQKQNRPHNGIPGGPKMSPEEAPKCPHNHIDQLNNRGTAAPSDGESFTLTPAVVSSPAKTTGPNLVGLWIDGYRRQTGNEYPESGKGKLGKTLKSLAQSFPDLPDCIDRWFAKSRKDYGIEIFKMRIEGGEAELTNRSTAGDDWNDPMSLHNGLKLAANGGNLA